MTRKKLVEVSFSGMYQVAYLEFFLGENIKLKSLGCCSSCNSVRLLITKEVVDLLRHELWVYKPKSKLDNINVTKQKGTKYFLLSVTLYPRNQALIWIEPPKSKSIHLVLERELMENLVRELSSLPKEEEKSESNKSTKKL